MARPQKKCKIKGQYDVVYYKPRRVPLCSLEEVTLTPSEIEAVRLADLEGLYQQDAAEQMDVSRQTFGNIINRAHKKIADALVTGKAIRIETIKK